MTLRTQLRKNKDVGDAKLSGSALLPQFQWAHSSGYALLNMAALVGKPAIHRVIQYS